MSDAPTAVLTDPYAIARRAYEQTADAMTRSIELVAGNPYLAATAGQVLNGYLALQETFRASVQATLAALQAPLGGEELSALTGRVAAVEAAVDGLARRTDALAEAVDREAGDTAVIDRLVKLEGRIEALRAVAEKPSANGLSERLGAIEKKLDDLGTPAPAPAPEQKIVKATAVTPAAVEAPAEPAKKPAARRSAAPRARKDTPSS